MKRLYHCYWLTLLQILLHSHKVVQERLLPLFWLCSLVLTILKSILK